jgi:hypothetical protein
MALAGVLLLIAGCGGSSKAPPHAKSKPRAAPAAAAGSSATSASASAAVGADSVSASAGGVTATMRAGTHTPSVGSWPVHFSVTRAGQPVKASVSYEYLFAGQVVARRSHYSFNGRFSDVFQWPAEAAGYPLTFRAVITAGRSVIDLDYPVQVHR